jgi:putative endonuclease
MPDTRKQQGQRGEQAALAYLQEQGYSLVNKNWRHATGEIDLIMQHGDELVFVEVRSKRGNIGFAAESVNANKQARLVALAYTYLEQANTPAQQAWRIDVIAISIGPQGQISQIEHLRNAVGEF